MAVLTVLLLQPLSERRVPRHCGFYNITAPHTRVGRGSGQGMSVKKKEEETYQVEEHQVVAVGDNISPKAPQEFAQTHSIPSLVYLRERQY